MTNITYRKITTFFGTQRTEVTVNERTLGYIIKHDDGYRAFLYEPFNARYLGTFKTRKEAGTEISVYRYC